MLDPNSVREGGQALVYRASFEGRRLAVKVARRVGTAIARERDALAKLRDKHADAGEWVVELVDSGQTQDGRDFIVLNWYSCSLEEWLEKPHSFAERLWVLEHCAEVVTRLHRAADLREQYLHRDIKPGNFLIDESESPPRVVLADLGGVKDGRMLATTQFEGLHSPGFAPAEQGLPLAQRPDPSLDVHGLAATIYAGLCGRLPDAKMVPIRLGSDARRLMFLHLTGGAKRDPAEEKEYAILSRHPAEHFLDLDDLKALTEADSARLINHFRDELAAGGSVANAGEIVGPLLAELRAGLEPDPRLRSRDPRRLYAVMVDVREAVEAAIGAVQAPRRSAFHVTTVPLPGDDAPPVAHIAASSKGVRSSAAVSSTTARLQPVPPPPTQPRELWPSTIAPVPAQAALRTETGVRRALPVVAALVGFGIVAVVAVGVGALGVWGIGAGVGNGAVSPEVTGEPPVIVPDVPGEPPDGGGEQVTPNLSNDKGETVDVVVRDPDEPPIGKTGTQQGKAIVEPKPPVVKPLASPPERKIIDPPLVAEPGAGVRVKVVNGWADNYPEVIVRLGNATSYTLSPTNREVAFDVPNGDSTITVESKDTRKAIRGCVWNLWVSSLQGGNGQISVEGGPTQTVANGSAHRLECKAP